MPQPGPAGSSRGSADLRRSPDPDAPRRKVRLATTSRVWSARPTGTGSAPGRWSGTADSRCRISSATGRCSTATMRARPSGVAKDCSKSRGVPARSASGQGQKTPPSASTRSQVTPASSRPPLPRWHAAAPRRQSCGSAIKPHTFNSLAELARQAQQAPPDPSLSPAVAPGERVFAERGPPGWS